MRYKSIKEGIPMGQKALNSTTKRDYSMGFELEMYVNEESIVEEPDYEKVNNYLFQKYGSTIEDMFLSANMLDYFRNTGYLSFKELIVKFDYTFNSGYTFVKFDDNESIFKDPYFEKIWDITEEDITNGKIPLDQLGEIIFNTFKMLVTLSENDIKNAKKRIDDAIQNKDINFFTHNLKRFKEKIKNNFTKVFGMEDKNEVNAIIDDNGKINSLEHYFKKIKNRLIYDPYDSDLTYTTHDLIKELKKYDNFSLYIEKNDEDFSEYEESIVSNTMKEMDWNFNTYTKATNFAQEQFEKVINVDRIYKDGSLRESDLGIEVVSEPYDTVADGLAALERAFDLMSDGDFYTDRSTGLHVTFGTFSRDEKNQIDWLKFFLILHGDRVLDQFNRSENTYTSIKRISDSIRDMVPGKYENYFSAIRDINQELLHGATKYDFVNLSKLSSGLIEFRAMGNEDYHLKFDTVKENILRFVRALELASDPNAYRKEYMTKLSNVINKNSKIDTTNAEKLGYKDMEKVVQALLTFKGEKMDRYKRNRYSRANPSIILNDLIREMALLVDLVGYDQNDTIEKTAKLIEQKMPVEILKFVKFLYDKDRINLSAQNHKKDIESLVNEVKDNPEKYPKLKKLFQMI